MKISVNRNDLMKSKGNVKISLSEAVSIQDIDELNKILAEILACRIEGGDNENID